MNGRFIDGERGELARRLFESARDDAPPLGAQARALSALGIAAGVTASSAVASAVAPEASTAVTGAAVVKWVITGAAIAIVSVGTLAVVARGFSGADDSTTRVVNQSAAPAPLPVKGALAPAAGEQRAVAAHPEAPAGAVIPFESLPQAEPAPERSSRPESAPVRRAESRVHSTLAQEVESLDRVRLALSSSDSAGALRELDAFASRFPSAALGPESTVLRVQALLQAGSRPAAERLARRFIAASPGSPHAARIRLLLEGRSKAGAGD